MKPFEILGSESGAVNEHPETDNKVLRHFTDVRVRLWEGFHWVEDGAKLLRKLQAAAELNGDENGE